MLADVLIDTLRLGGQDDSDLAARWRAVNPRGLVELVAHEGAAIWIFRRLRAAGVLDGLPPAISDRLRRQAIEAAALRLEVEAEAGAVVTILNRAKVPVILIKGVARCALASRYPYLDARATQDVDLLVPYDASAAAEAALRADGYVAALPPESAATPQGHHHLPPLHKGGITVELHTSTSTRVPPEVAWSRANVGSEVLAWGGEQVRVPSVTELAWSAIEHAMEDEVHGFRLARLLELAALVSHDAPIDWAIVGERRATERTFGPAAGIVDQQSVIAKWIGAAFRVVAAAKWPKDRDTPRFDLAELLTWRLMVLRARPMLGHLLSERLLGEGARAAVGLPVEPSPATASPWGKLRRPIAGYAIRALFKLWRATRRQSE